MSFDHATTTDDVLEGIDLSGTRAIVTGASGGLGEETARALASKGAVVTIAARDGEKLRAAADGIRQSTGNEQVDTAELELDKPASVRAFAGAWLEKHDSLNLLINNAMSYTDYAEEIRIKLDVSKSTAKSHLAFLQNEKLVQRIDAGNKYSNFHLSDKGVEALL